MLLPLRTALAFLTILPVRLPDKLSAADLRRSAAWFPAAGLVLGGFLTAAAFLFARINLPAPVGGVLLVGLGAGLTRGLHLDGVADFFDGLGGSHEPERRLAIMKDSATGAFGVIGLVLLLLLKAALFSVLLEGMGGVVLLLILFVPMTARWSMASLCYRAEYPRAAGTGHAFVGQVGVAELIVGFALLLPVMVLAGPIAGCLLAVSLLPAFFLRFVAGRAFGGITGDVLGACCEFSETCTLLAAVILLSRPAGMAAWQGLIPY